MKLAAAVFGAVLLANALTLAAQDPFQAKAEVPVAPAEKGNQR